MTFGGVVLAITASRFTDLLFGYIKVTIIGLILVSTAMFGWFLFTMNGMLPFGKGNVVWVLLYALLISFFFHTLYITSVIIFIILCGLDNVK